MIRKSQYAKLKSNANVIVNNFKSIFLDRNNILTGDLNGYFEEDNTIIEDGKLKFEIGQYRFTVEPDILLKGGEANIVLRTFEEVSSIYRLSKNNHVEHVHASDLDMIFRFNFYATPQEEYLTVKIKGKDKMPYYPDVLIEQYCKLLISYIEDIESPKKGAISAAN